MDAQAQVRKAKIEQRIKKSIAKMRDIMGDLAVNFKVFLIFSLAISLVIPKNSTAEEVIHGVEGKNKHIHGLHEECPLPKNKMDIIECALIFHPSVKRGVLQIDSQAMLEDKASQIPNPTISARYVKGGNDGNEVSELETNLFFTVELGDKRGSRKEFALAKRNEATATNDAVKAQIKIVTILNMHRLRQVFEEKKLLEEAILAFSKVIRELRKLPRLSAEQEASLTLFEMVLEETKVNESELFEEERKLEHYFHISTGHSVKEIKKYLPNTPSKWPVISDKITETVSPDIKKLKSLASLAQKELEIQKSEAWPDLKIGPSFSIEKDGVVENKMIGFNIQIPIPLFQVNGGGKAYARSELVRAQKNIALSVAEENHERFEQLRVYESSVNILNKTMKQALIEKKHDRIEKLYLRGVVSSSVFLDSLKQKISYLKSRNLRELTAIKALWSIHKFDGKILEERI